MCVKGAKAVVFVTGACQFPPTCSWYCPISKERRGVPVAYVDELKIVDDGTITHELDSIGAKGVSFTGGDPLATGKAREMVFHYLNLVKRAYGPRFHAHLYTNGQGFTEALAGRLAEAGLDEIRFHWLPGTDSCHDPVLAARSAGLSVGVEIPAIPTRDYLDALVEFLPVLKAAGVEFLNLNEFEMTETNSAALRERGFEYDPDTLASVTGTTGWVRRLLRTLRKARDLPPSLHYCTTRLKDGVQVRNRYKRRAQRVAEAWESPTGEGLLVYGAARGPRAALLEVATFVREKTGRLSASPLLTNAGGGSGADDAGETWEVRFPWHLLGDGEFVQFLSKLALTAGIVEVLPLDDRPACEFTPVVGGQAGSGWT